MELVQIEQRRNALLPEHDIFAEDVSHIAELADTLAQGKRHRSNLSERKPELRLKKCEVK